MNSEERKWVINTIISVVAVIIPIAIYSISLSKKAFEFDLISYSELIGNDVSFDDLEIKIGNEKVERISVSTIKMGNRGSEPITKNDFERAFLIVFDKDSIVYNTKIKNKYPENLSLQYQIENNKIRIDPLLLNPKDEFVMEVLSSSSSYPKVDARISGIKEIVCSYPDSKNNFILGLNYITSFILLVFYAKFLRTAITRNSIQPKKYQRFTNGLAATFCAFSSVLLIRYGGYIENIKVILLIMLIPMAIGFLWSIFERKYNITLNAVG